MLTSTDNFTATNTDITSNPAPPALPKALQEVLDSAVDGSLIFVYVKKFLCASETPEETEIKKQIELHPKPIYFYTICYRIHEIQFPEPATEMVYIFKPKSKWFTMLGKAEGFAKNLSNIINAVEEQEKHQHKFVVSSQEQADQQIEMLNNEVLEEFPSAFQQARGLIKHSLEAAKNLVQGKPILVSAQVAASRLATCESCEHYRDKRCVKCGCFMEQKAHFAISTCPMNKWVPIPL